jgi:hypothetical protein
LFILQGAVETIDKHVFGLEIEVEFVELYESQPLFSDVDRFVRKHGFQLFDLQRGYWKRALGKRYGKKRGQLVFGNALYLRKTEDFIEMTESREDQSAKKVKALKAISICLLYGYLDYAMELIDVAGSLFSKGERAKIEKKFAGSITLNTRLPNFRGRRSIANCFHSLWESFRLTYDGWATVDRKLGNL